MNAELSPKSQEAFQAAATRATGAGAPQIEPVHLLLAMLEQPDSVVNPLLEKVGANPQAVRSATEAAIAALPKVSGSSVGAPQATRQVIAALSGAQKAATAAGDENVEPEHLLVGLAEAGGDAAKILKDAGASADALAAA
ncbi:MAG: ATP-dependent Clp protease ATP-binding subunit ClpB, partial [Frankiaceae bacterium]|nr:ATP-dependent Clp protease ATP-binding subunit ClpB [Frankiaceae bacterium]